MAKIRFYLKEQTGKSTCIFMMLHFGASTLINGRKKYLPLKYYINENICPAHWNKRIGRAKELKAYPQYILLNERLRMIENTAYSILLQFKNQPLCLSAKQLREALNKALNIAGEPVQTNFTFFSFIEQFINSASNSKTRATIVQYKNTLRLLKSFAQQRNKDLNFEHINLTFHAEFREYMNELGYSETYFGNQIKFIRLFMNEATERGYNMHVAYKSKKFTSPAPPLVKIYLTESEIARIQSVPISDRTLRTIRDLFIIGCRTGLRFSDLMQLNPGNFIEEKKIVRIETKKTKELVYIPLSPDVKTICRQYGYQLPHCSNTLFNIGIKQIGRLAGITDEIEVVVSKGNSTQRKLVRKYELICAHTARRSFATNAYLANVPSIAIMRITGHRTEKAFMKYICIANENNARQLLEHPYFLNTKGVA